MVDIQSPTAEIRRGKKKKERRRNHRMEWPITQAAIKRQAKMKWFSQKYAEISEDLRFRRIYYIH